MLPHILSVVAFVFAFSCPRRLVAIPSKSSSSLLNSEPSDGFSLPTDEYAVMVAEFVFNVAGDHILYPVSTNREDDIKLHTNAMIIAAMLQKLHVMDRLCRLLNDTAHDVIADKSIAIDNPNRINIVLDRVIEKIALDPDLSAAFVECAAKERDGRQESEFLTPDHGKYASSKAQTMYDINSDQFVHAAELFENRRVKKLVMSVSLLKASDYDLYPFTPASVRENTKLAEQVLTLASRVELRDRIQRVYDETLDECADKFDVISGNVADMFDRLRAKLKDDPVLKKELEF